LDARFEKSPEDMCGRIGGVSAGNCPRRELIHHLPKSMYRGAPIR
jgi:hypothetical protein